MRVLATFAGALLLASCQPLQAPPSADDVVRFFNDLAFRGSFGGHPMSGQVLAESDYNQHRLFRWQFDSPPTGASPSAQAVRVEVRGEAADQHRRQVGVVLDRVGAVTGLKVALLGPGESDSNFVVEFVAKEGFLINRVEYAPCYAHSEFRAQRLDKVTIQISIEKPDIVKHCIVHEMFHGFGLAHSHVLPSVLNSKMMPSEPSPWDEIALKTFYDPRLQSGMTRQEALPIARKIILEQLANRR